MTGERRSIVEQAAARYVAMIDAVRQERRTVLLDRYGPVELEEIAATDEASQNLKLIQRLRETINIMVEERGCIPFLNAEGELSGATT